MSLRSVNSAKADSMVDTGVSARCRRPESQTNCGSTNGPRRDALESTTKKFFFPRPSMCPVPASSNPVIVSCPCQPRKVSVEAR